jgi:hypothetical protein
MTEREQFLKAGEIVVNLSNAIQKVLQSRDTEVTQVALLNAYDASIGAWVSELDENGKSLMQQWLAARK